MSYAIGDLKINLSAPNPKLFFSLKFSFYLFSCSVLVMFVKWISKVALPHTCYLPLFFVERNDINCFELESKNECTVF